MSLSTGTQKSGSFTGVILPTDGGNHLRRGATNDPLLESFMPGLPPVGAPTEDSP